MSDPSALDDTQRLPVVATDEQILAVATLYAEYMTACGVPDVTPQTCLRMARIMDAWRWAFTRAGV
jgi:hypothetical protein